MIARWIGWTVGLGMAVLALWAARQPRVNDVMTGQTPEYPDLQPRHYSEDPRTVFHAVQAVARTRRGWRVAAADAERGTLHAEARVPLTPFTDDVTVYVEPLDSGIAQCIWHRIVLFGSLPAGTRIRVRAFCADEKLSGPELDSLAAWHDCAVAETFDDDTRLNALCLPCPWQIEGCRNAIIRPGRIGQPLHQGLERHAYAPWR